VLGRALAGGLLTAAVAAVFLFQASLAAGAPSSSKPPKITAHAETPVVNAGEQLSLSLTAKNRGKAKSAKLRLRLLLSADRRESKGDAVLGKLKIPAVKPRKSKTVSFSAKVPAGAAPAAYSVLLCGSKCRPMKGSVGVGPPVQRINVTPALASGDAASAPVGVDGGRVDVVASDGTLYSLLVPAGALASPTQITMTPLAGLAGSPLGGELIGGVQLEPDGLELARVATLVISGDRIVAGPGQAAFGYHGAGSDFHLEPLYRAGHTPAGLEDYDPSRTIVVPVSHFSGTGIQPATNIDAVRDLRHGAMEARDRLAERAAKAIQKERDGGESASEDLASVLNDYLDQVVIPDAAAASFSDALYANGLQSYVSWQRQLELLGIQGDFGARIAQVEKLLDAAFKALVKRLSDRCKAGDLAIQTRILGLERQLQLLGTGDHASEFADLIDECYRFELRVISHLEIHNEGDLGGGTRSKTDYSIELQGAAPLTVDGYLGVGELGGVGPFNYSLLNLSGNGRVDFGGFGYEECTDYGTGGSIPGQLSVLGGNLPYRTGEMNGVKGVDIPATILLDPGDPQEEIHSDCQGAALGQPTSSSENRYEDNWQKYFRFAHFGESIDRNSGNGPWLLHDLKPGRHPILAEQTVDVFRAEEGATVTESFQLVHTPAK
jgi:hypothetical protein